MSKIIIDGVSYEVNSDNNLLQECLSQGLDLPYFCWHPCMGSVGACRQCAVKQYKDADDEQGMIVMACMTPATDGAIISIEDQQAKKFRAQVIESLMISHPHDCPVCEEGGECHLQDMTLMSGHNYRRYDKKKVTHRNQYLGPFINHEMNRCIACYRCVRYYDDYAGGTDLAAQAAHHHVYFGRHTEGVLESEFSGNLVEVCPTGVFTDKTFSAHYTRKWDLQTAPSVCVGCAVGCNTAPGERYGTLRRVVNRYNSEINGYFLCDRGRFGADFVNSAERLTAPLRKMAGEVSTISTAEAREVLAQSRQSGPIGIGSPRASNEANYALRCLVGADNFYSGSSDAEHEAVQLMLNLARDPAFHIPSVRDIERCDAVLVLGEDVTNTAPRIALAVRQAVRNKARDMAQDCNIPQWQDAAVRELAQHERSPLIILSPFGTRLDDVVTESHALSPQGIRDFGIALANMLDGAAPAAKAAEPDKVSAVAETLTQARRPLVIAGTGLHDPDMVRIAANIARALGTAREQGAVDLCLVTPEVNSMGMGLLAEPANSLGAALARMEAGGASQAVVLENDLFCRASHDAVGSALDKLDCLIVLDQLSTPTTERANYVLPTTSFAEHEATYVNYEGRAQLSFQVHRCHSEAQPAWRWLGEEPDSSVESFVNRCAEELKNFESLDDLLPDASRFVAGMKIPRQSHRYSGRTAMKSNLNVHEPKQAVDTDSVFSFSMEGIPPQKDSSLIASSWAPRWNSNQSISKFQEEINGELKQGHTGTRLLPKTTEPGDYLQVASAPADAGAGLALAHAQQIFGSDELSARSPAIKERMTAPYIGLSREDAERLQLTTGDCVSLNGNGALALVCVRARVPAGTGVLYAGAGEIDTYAIKGLDGIEKSSAQLNGTLGNLIISDLVAEEGPA